MASVIEDVSNLPGETVHDQEGRKFGQVKEIYAVGDDTPMWVTVEVKTGVGRTRLVFIPLARLKQEEDEIRAPYSFQHLHDAPEVKGEELSEDDDRTLRSYYGIGLADQEMVASAQSYASQVPDEDEPARKVDESEVKGKARELDEREPGEAAREAEEAEREEKDDDEDDRKGRKTTAEDVLGEDKDEPEDKDRSEDKGGSEDKDSSEAKDESEDD